MAYSSNPLGAQNAGIRLLTILRSYLSFVPTIAMLRSKLAQNSAIVQLDTNRYSLPAWYLEMANISQTGKFWQTDKGGWGECFYLTVSNKESETVSAVWTRAKLGVKIWIAKQVLYRTLSVKEFFTFAIKCRGGGEEFVKSGGQFSTHKKDNSSGGMGWGRATVILAVSLSPWLHQHKNRKKERPQFIR